MARGWESKSVEQQQEERRSDAAATHEAISAEERARRVEIDTLKMSRARVLQQLEHCHDPRYEKMLRSALADLDSRLAQLQSDRKS